MSWRRLIVNMLIAVWLLLFAFSLFAAWNPDGAWGDGYVTRRGVFFTAVVIGVVAALLEHLWRRRGSI